MGFVKLKATSDEIAAMDNGEIARPSMVLMDTEVYPSLAGIVRCSRFDVFFVDVFVRFNADFQLRHGSHSCFVNRRNGPTTSAERPYPFGYED